MRSSVAQRRSVCKLLTSDSRPREAQDFCTAKIPVREQRNTVSLAVVFSCVLVHNLHELPSFEQSLFLSNAQKTVVNSHMLWLRYLHRAGPHRVKMGPVNSLSLRRCLEAVDQDLTCARPLNVFNGRHDAIIDVCAGRASTRHHRKHHVIVTQLPLDFHRLCGPFADSREREGFLQTVPLRSAPRSSY